MPTAPKLVAAVLMAALGYGVAALIAPTLRDEILVGYFREITAVLGLPVGWMFLGRRAGQGMPNAIGFGLTASAILTFVALLVFSAQQMLQRAFRMSYDGPLGALEDMVLIGIDYLSYLSPPPVYGALLAGGLVAGILVELSSKVWR